MMKGMDIQNGKVQLTLPRLQQVGFSLQSFVKVIVRQ